MAKAVIQRRIGSGTLPKDYLGLIQLFPLRPVRDQIELRNGAEIAGRLAGLIERTQDQEDYYHVLTGLLIAYQDEHPAFDTSHVTTLDIVKSLMEDRNLNESDLGRIIGHRTMGHKIMSGERQLNKKHIEKLAAYFKVSPALFFD